MTDSPEPFVSSDPGAWIRPYYAAIAQRPGFFQLAPAHQFAALLDAIAADYPTRAAELRDSTTTTQSAILGWLHDVTSQKPPAREVEMWRVRKGERELRAVAVYLPTGIDWRLLERDDFRRTDCVAMARLCTLGPPSGGQSYRTAGRGDLLVTGPVTTVHRGGANRRRATGRPARSAGNVEIERSRSRALRTCADSNQSGDTTRRRRGRWRLSTDERDRERALC